MQYACMSVNITIRDIPKEVRDELASKAALEGQSMQEYLRAELIQLSKRQSVSNWMNAVAERKATYKTRVPPSTILKARNADRK